MTRRRRALASTFVALAALACGCKGTSAERVERAQYANSAVQQQLDATRNELARVEQDRNADREARERLLEQIKTHDELDGVLKKQVANLRRENERLQTELTSTVVGGAATKAVSATSKEPDPFRIPAAVVGRLNAFAGRFPDKVRYNNRIKALQLNGDWLFEQGDRLTPQGDSALRAFAAAMQPQDSRSLKLIIAVQVGQKVQVPRELESRFPTDWHLASAQAIEVQQNLEKYGIPATNMGVTVQQYPDEGNKKPRVEIYLNAPDVNEG